MVQGARLRPRRLPNLEKLMTSSTLTSRQQFARRTGLLRRYREFALTSRDPVLFIGLLFSGIFLFVFVFYPLLRTSANGFSDASGRLSLEYFGRYFGFVL